MDIVLDDGTETITLDGPIIYIKGGVLTLEKPGQRDPRDSREYAWYRRALVQDVNDVLTINAGGDYFGGVLIQGQVRIDQALQIGSVTIQPTTEGGNQLAINGATDTLGKATFRDGIKISSGDLAITGLPATGANDDGLTHQLVIDSNTIRVVTKSRVEAFPHTLDLVDEVRSLRSEVDRLKAEVAALQAKLP